MSQQLLNRTYIVSPLEQVRSERMTKTMTAHPLRLPPETSSKDLSQRTVNKQIGIVSRFVDYICFDCDLKKMDDISVGMANSYFRKWHLSKIRDATDGQLKTAIGNFFLYLYDELNIRNEHVVQSFKRK